jgi:lipoate-protein ligase B
MSKPATLLRHIRCQDLIKFAVPQNLQDQLARQFLDYKATISSSNPPSLTPPTPTIISFQPKPVYTTGRREHETLSDEKLALLKEPLVDKEHKRSWKSLRPEVWPTLRGGQTTFHGPGQLVIYPIIDLRAKYPLWPKGLSPRCYVNLLEQTTIDTLASWDLKGIRTENPGVWAEDGERKIAALGVHLRRNITSYGVGLNVNTDLRYFDRIVACGLPGKKVTSMKELIQEKGGKDFNPISSTTHDPSEHGKDKSFQEENEHELGGDLVGKTILTEPSDVNTEPTQDKVAREWVREFMKGLYGEDAMDSSYITHDWQDIII